MKSLPLCLLALCLFVGTSPAQQAAAPLPADVLLQMQEIQELQVKRRYVEAMNLLDEIEAKYPDRPELLNIRGSLYLTPALRDFAKADEMFDKALKLAPNEFPLLFNKAEVLFVKHDWAAAAKAFQKLLDDHPKLPLVYRHMVLFKRLICEVKQDQLPTAEKSLADNFTFMDDSPAYYYSKAAIAFHKKEEPAAQDWVKRAAGIFKPAENSAYVDCLMEARWMPNIGLPEDAPKEPGQ
ncbi:MAG: tetratricopeptide repeat protein [Verrucomicrobiota bacterium]